MTVTSKMQLDQHKHNHLLSNEPSFHNQAWATGSTNAQVTPKFQGTHNSDTGSDEDGDECQHIFRILNSPQLLSTPDQQNFPEDISRGLIHTQTIPAVGQISSPQLKLNVVDHSREKYMENKMGFEALGQAYKKDMKDSFN
jgi:hypothetical protein